jgi:hypothetical protein
MTLWRVKKSLFPGKSGFAYDWIFFLQRDIYAAEYWKFEEIVPWDINDKALTH